VAVAETSYVHTRALAQAENSRLSKVTSRSGERSSPKRECVGTLACRCSFSPDKGWPRSGEEGSPKRELASLAGLFVDSLA